MNDAH